MVDNQSTRRHGKHEGSVLRSDVGRSRRGDAGDGPDGVYDRIFAVVRRIPIGRVATYGQVADLADLPGHARQVGYALHSLGRGLARRSAVPWQRVVNARGEVSRRVEPTAELAQRSLLEGEGVKFDARGRIRLAEFQWEPRRRRPRRRSGRAKTAESSGSA